MNNLPKRKPLRLSKHDYSKNGVYFVTICVIDRHCILGKIHVGDDALGVPLSEQRHTVELSSIGKIVDEQLNDFSHFYDHIKIDRYIIMPNHIHMILVVSIDGTSRAPSPTTDNENQALTDKFVPQFVSTLKRFIHKKCGFTIFQRSYNDRIVRNYEEYNRICKYIHENPRNWKHDKYH